MNLSKTIISITVAASMVGAAGYVYAQQTDSSTTNRDAVGARSNISNNANAPRGTAGGSYGTTDSTGKMNNNSGMNTSSGSTSNPTLRDGTAGDSIAADSTERDGTMSNRTKRHGKMSNRTMRDDTGERIARADRN